MKTVHLLFDESEKLNSNRKTICGLQVGQFPPDNHWIEERLAAVHLANEKERTPCPVCFPEGRPQFGTPLSKLSGRSGEPGYAEFRRIARSWGYD